MAQLRLIALLALAASCRTSEAETGSGITPPAGWQALPTLAKAASDAAKDAKIAIDRVEAWGETSRGCYAASFALRGSGGAPDVMAEQLVTSLSADPAVFGILIRDVQKPPAGAKTGVLTLAFERGLYRGTLRASLASDGNIAALACFWNQREPAACEQACTTLLGSLP